MRIEIKDKINFIKMFNQLFENKKIKDINALTIDSRKVMKNDIFIPIIGTKYDGHRFIDSSFKNGAIACFSEKSNYAKNIINTSSNIKAIELLAKSWGKITKSKIIGITGSNGKTTTKDLLFHILSKKFKCSKTSGNYNSKIGLPLAFLNSKKNDEFCILEYGANKPNEIEYLCKLIKPDLGLITNISNAHIGNFPSIDEIIKTKSAIYKNLSNSDIAFVNNDDKNIKKIKLKSKKITFGFKNPSNILGEIKNQRIIKINNKDTILIPKSLFHIKENLLSVYTIANHLNINIDDINEALNSFVLPQGRGRKIMLDEYQIIDDSYNANPKSVKLAIERFESETSIGGKKIFIFGDMLELGESTKKEHEAIGEILNKSKIDIIMTLGIFSKNTFDEITNNKIHKKHYYSINELKNDFFNTVNKNDIVYLKGSRSMKLEQIYKKD